MSMVRRHTPVAAVGPGIRVLPPGCTGSGWKRSLASVCEAHGSSSIPVFHPPGPITRSPTAIAQLPVKLSSRIQAAQVAASESVVVDGRAVAETVIELADDGRHHKVQIALGS